ncbi:MAG: L-threonylcarbamoyladenylate synthase [Thermodesulfobacteriota bacterium]|nr:L-threonylcarbamoyladenylate synthase [Thermodesulfobacteriota bacterium]
MTLKVNPYQPDDRIIKKAAKIVNEGGVIAFPTETFYGLAALAFDTKAIKRLFLLKKRPFSSPIAILIKDKHTLIEITKEIPEEAEKLIERFWPGPLTIVFSARENIPDLLTSGKGKIGMRISASKIAQSLVQNVGFPITATSANISGDADPIEVNQIASTLGTGIDLILDGGRATLNKASTILDVTTKPFKVLREGAIRKKEIFSCLDTE